MIFIELLVADYFENYDLDTITTPVNTKELKKLLIQTNYNSDKTKELVHNFEHGFSLGYTGPTDVKIASRNLKFRGVSNKCIL